MATGNCRYSGPVKSRADLDAVLDDVGLVELSRLVHFLSGRLQTLCHLDELVHPISDSGETVAFFMELALLLREMRQYLFRRVGFQSVQRKTNGIPLLLGVFGTDLGAFFCRLSTEPAHRESEHGETGPARRSAAAPRFPRVRRSVPSTPRRLKTEKYTYSPR